MARKKKAAAAKLRAGSKKKAPKKRAARETNGEQPEIDVSELARDKALSRLGTIYQLGKAVERKRIAHDMASQRQRAAKAELEEAQEQLEQEIHEQRVGPGPLFNAAGTGPAENGAKAKGPRAIVDDGDNDGEVDTELGD